MLAAKAVADHTGVLEQLTLAEFIRSGGYDRHVRGRRLTYRRRRDLLLRTLARSAPAVAVTGIAAGLHALVTLPEGVSEEEIGVRAARRGLTVAGLAQYRAGGPVHPPALVVGYATPPDHAYTGALARLVAALTPPAPALTPPSSSAAIMHFAAIMHAAATGRAATCWRSG